MQTNAAYGVQAKRSRLLWHAVQRAIVFKILRYSGLPFLFKTFIQRSKITIISFHDIPKDRAEQTLRYLQRNYRVIGLSTFIEKCRSGDHCLPARSLILTLDDGYIGNRELLPLLRKMELPVTIFVCAGIIDTRRHFWFKQCTTHYYVSQLLRVSNYQRLASLQSVGFAQDREYPEPQALTKSQIEDMKPYCDFQAHTLFHPSLPRCGYEEAKKEITECKRVLEDRYGLKVYAFAYPHGDYSDRDIALCRQAGYDCAITSDHGFNTTRTDLFRLKRVCINDADGLDAVVVKASGLWGSLRNLMIRNPGYGWSARAEEGPRECWQRELHEDHLRPWPHVSSDKTEAVEFSGPASPPAKECAAPTGDLDSDQSFAGERL